MNLYISIILCPYWEKQWKAKGIICFSVVLMFLYFGPLSFQTKCFLFESKSFGTDIEQEAFLYFSVLLVHNLAQRENSIEHDYAK